MNPASSSSDDDGASSSSSSSISAPSKEGTIQTKPRHARSSNDRSAAPSDDDEDESGDEASSDEEDDESGPDSDEHDDDYGDVNDFDDLPTDDSESDDDPSDSDSDNNEKQHSSRSDDSGEDSRGEDNDDEDVISQDDIPLSERIASKAGLGRRYYTGDDTTLRDNTHDAGGKQQKVERKQRAIELASERLREVRKGQRKDHHSNQSSSGDDNDDDDDDDGDSSIERTPSNKNNPTTKNKKSKHAPTEMSSKRHDYFSRGRPDLNSSGIGISIGANKYKARDPRMISLSGHLDADAFEKRYDFLDEIQEKEIESLKSRVKAWKTSGKKGQRARRKLGLTSGGNASSLEEDQEELTRLLQERAERQRANVVRAAKRSVKSKLRNEVASGTRGAYYPKRSELKKMEAEAKFDEIRKRGGNEAVDAAIAKRRKKNVAKEARSMPSHMIS